MSIKGITFDYQTPTAKGHRAGFNGALTDGVLSGSDITYNGSSITVTAGYLVICGGIVEIVGSESISVPNTGTYARLKAAIDLDGAATTTAFNQVTLTVETANSVAAFPALNQDDINNDGTLYEAELAVVKVGTAGLIRSAKATPKIPYGTTLPSTAGVAGEIFLLKV